MKAADQSNGRVWTSTLHDDNVRARWGPRLRGRARRAGRKGPPLPAEHGWPAARSVGTAFQVASPKLDQMFRTCVGAGFEKRNAVSLILLCGICPTALV